MSSLPRTVEEYRKWWAENTDVLYGHCWCGCGQPTNRITRARTERGIPAGAPQKYVLGHATRTFATPYLEENRGYTSPCWIWQGSKNTMGYGQTRINNKLQLAHRVYYERVYGPIGADRHLHHSCKQIDCVNPEHQHPLSPREHKRVEGGLKLSLFKARDIRHLYSTGSYSHSDLALRFGVSSGTIWDVLHNKYWRK